MHAKDFKFLPYLHLMDFTSFFNVSRQKTHLFYCRFVRNQMNSFMNNYSRFPALMKQNVIIFFFNIKYTYTFRFNKDPTNMTNNGGAE